MKVGIDRLLGAAMIFAGLSSLIFFSLAAAGIMTAAAIIIPTPFKMSDAMIGPHNSRRAKPIPARMAGAASSLTGSIRQVTGAGAAISWVYLTMVQACHNGVAFFVGWYRTACDLLLCNQASKPK